MARYDAYILRVWRSTGRYNLPFVKIGRVVRYRRGDLAAFIDCRRRTTDRQPDAA